MPEDPTAPDRARGVSALLSGTNISAIGTRSDLSAPSVVRNANRLDASTHRKVVTKNFANFMWKSWMTWFGNPPTKRMYDIGERLQHGPNKDIIMGFRGVAKSFITVDFGVWKLDLDPTEIVLTLSGSDRGAKGNAILAWSMITQWDWLQHMAPSGSLRASSQEFDVAGSRMEKTPSFVSNSLFGQNTGYRCSIALPDDVETPNTSETQGDRDRLRVRYAEIGGSILKPGGLVKVLGTAQAEQTLYAELVSDKGYGLFMLPVLYPTAKELPKYGVYLAPAILKELQANPELAGTSTEPARFSEADIAERRTEYGRTEFERQFMLWMDAGTGIANPLKLRDIPVVEVHRPDPTRNTPVLVPSTMQWSPVPQNAYTDIEVDSLTGDTKVYAPMMSSQDENYWQEPELKIMIIDPSGGGRDETAWGVLTQHLGLVGLVDMNARLDGFSAETMAAIAKDAALWKVHKVIIEKNFGGGMFGELLRPALFNAGHPCTIEEELAGQVQKEVRIIDSLLPVISDHRLWVAADVLRRDFPVTYEDVEQGKRRFYRLTYQLTRMTKTRGCIAHDDRLDMLATGVAKFIGTLRRQLEDAQRHSKEAWLLKQQEEIMESLRRAGRPVLGDPQPSYNKLQGFGFRGADASPGGGLSGSSLFIGRHGR